ncbi:unnamed protein product, partial [Phaeothamnion confervicola]
LGQDIARFRQKRAASAAGASNGGGGLRNLKEAFSWLLVADFFVVVAFLGWFAAGVAGSYVFHQDALLDKFHDSWSPLVMPALSVLMGGTIAGGVVSKLGEGGSDGGGATDR